MDDNGEVKEEEEEEEEDIALQPDGAVEGITR